MKSCLSLLCLPVLLVIACGGSADLGGGYDAGSCDQVCCVPSPIGVGTPSFQCVGARVACTLPNAACEPADAGASDASCAEVCCDPPPDGRGPPSFQCVAAGTACVLPNSTCLAGDAGPGADGGGVPCTTTADCFSLTSGGTNPYVCGYSLAGGCSAQGVCMPAGPLCNQPTPIACACDGTGVGYGACSGYPTGYAGKPTVHTGSCAADGGTLACQTAADCGPNQVCVQDYDPQVGSNPVSAKCIDNPCGTAPLACSCAVTPACSGFSVNCAIGSGGVVECLGNG